MKLRLALLLALQAAPPPAPPPLPIDFDLARVKPTDPCRTGGGGGSDIVVCGRRPGATYDYEKWERLLRTGPLTAETAIGPGAVAGLWVESVPMPGGQVSKRVLAGVKVKF